MDKFREEKIKLLSEITTDAEIKEIYTKLSEYAQSITALDEEMQNITDVNEGNKLNDAINENANEMKALLDGYIAEHEFVGNEDQEALDALLLTL